jgi:hypothetical protein
MQQLKDLYYDPRRAEAVGSYDKLARVAKQAGIAKPSEVKQWLEEQDAYNLHRPVGKRPAQSL